MFEWKKDTVRTDWATMSISILRSGFPGKETEESIPIKSPCSLKHLTNNTFALKTNGCFAQPCGIVQWLQQAKYKRDEIWLVGGIVVMTTSPFCLPHSGTDESSITISNEIGGRTKQNDL